jgi:hypothetical protein
MEKENNSSVSALTDDATLDKSFFEIVKECKKKINDVVEESKSKIYEHSIALHHQMKFSDDRDEKHMKLDELTDQTIVQLNQIKKNEIQC